MINDNTVMREKDMRHTNTSNSFVEYVKVLYGTILLKDMKYIRYDYSFFFVEQIIIVFILAIVFIIVVCFVILLLHIMKKMC